MDRRCCPFRNVICDIYFMIPSKAKLIQHGTCRTITSLHENTKLLLLTSFKNHQDDSITILLTRTARQSPSLNCKRVAPFERICCAVSIHYYFLLLAHAAPCGVWSFLRPNSRNKKNKFSTMNIIECGKTNGITNDGDDSNNKKEITGVVTCNWPPTCFY